MACACVASCIAHRGSGRGRGRGRGSSETLTRVAHVKMETMGGTTAARATAAARGRLVVGLAAGGGEPSKEDGKGESKG